jgi:helicase MOV-10
VHQSDIYVKFHDKFHDADKKPVNIRFDPPKETFRRAHWALQYFPKALIKPILFPEKSEEMNMNLARNKSEKFFIQNFHRKDLNLEQKCAVENFIFFPERFGSYQNPSYPALHSPKIIFGPPGTGKSVTLVECIFQLCGPQKINFCMNNPKAPRPFVLATAPSNSAADLIAQRVSDFLNPKHLIRLNAASVRISKG